MDRLFVGSIDAGGITRRAVLPRAIASGFPAFLQSQFLSPMHARHMDRVRRFVVRVHLRRALSFFTKPIPLFSLKYFKTREPVINGVFAQNYCLVDRS